jgi:tetratricopeptide (TPR) repeat protein
MKILIVLLYACVTVMGTTETARNAYLNKNYASAKQGFSTLVSVSPYRFSNHYNLGSTYYRLDEPILSKLHYLKALRLKPNDPDTHFNLRLINKKLIDQHFIFDQHQSVILGINSKPLLALMLLLNAIIIGAIFWIDLHKISNKTYRLGIVFIFIWGSCLMVFSVNHLNSSKFGLITQKKTQVYSGPSKTQTALFFVHEGAEYKLLNKTREWSNVQFPNGLSGWITNSAGQNI